MSFRGFVPAKSVLSRLLPLSLLTLAVASLFLVQPTMASASTSASTSTTTGSPATVKVSATVPSKGPSAGSPNSASSPAQTTSPASVADATDEQCAGNLTFGRIVSCPSVTATKSRVYKFSTRVAKDTVYIDLHQPESAYLSASITAADGTFICYATSSYPTSCAFATAGTYTVTVTNPFGGPPEFTLSVESALTTSKCTSLPDSFFSMSSPGMSGTLPAGTAAMCFSFSQPTGSVLWNAALGVSPGYPSGGIYDAQNQPLCPISYSGGQTCTLSTAGPYKLFLHELYGNETAYTLRMPRLSQSTGCAPLKLAPFGDPGDAAVTASVTYTQQYTCAKVHLASAGPIGIRFSDLQQLFWTLYDNSGVKVCDSYANGRTCPAPAAGDYTLFIQDIGFLGDAHTFTVTAAAQYDNAGCQAATSTAWDTTALVVHQTSPAQTNCQIFEGTAGDRVMTYSAPVQYNSVAAWIVDATGNPVCPTFSGDGQDGCVLPATGTYRVLSYLDTWDKQNPDETYWLQIRRLNNPAGCLAIKPGTYGTAPVLGGIRCRILTVPAAGTYTVAPVDSQNYQLSGDVYDVEGLRVCYIGGNCAFPAAGNYTLVLDGGNPSSVIDNDYQYTVAFLTAVPTGCGTLSDSADPIQPYHGSLVPGQHDCLQLPTPAGARITESLPPSATGAARPVVTILDATGTFVCDSNYPLLQGSCQLTGSAPFYAVVTASNGSPAGPYAAALVRTDGPPSCPTLPGTADGVTVTTSPAHFAQCLSIPATGHSATATFTYTRTSGSGGATMQVYDSAGLMYCAALAPADTRTVTCSLPAGPVTVILDADDVDATYQVTYTP